MSRAAQRRPAVVIVDDESIVCESLRIQLESAGFRATAVNDPSRALATIQAEKPDLVVLDLYMPGVDGREIARALRADPATSTVRILLLTGSNEAVDVVTGLDSGASDYMTKPVDGETIAAKIRSMLNMGAAPRAKAGSKRGARRAR